MKGSRSRKMKAWKQGWTAGWECWKKDWFGQERLGYIDGEGKNSPVTKIPSLSCLVSSLIQGSIYTCKSLAFFDFVLIIHNPTAACVFQLVCGWLVGVFCWFACLFSFPLSEQHRALGVFELFCMGHCGCLVCSLKISEVFYQVKHILLTFYQRDHEDIEEKWHMGKYLSQMCFLCLKLDCGGFLFCSW